MGQTAKHVIWISLDGVFEKDWDTLRSLPAISALAAAGAFSSAMTSVYPTLTYTVHTSLATGCLPARHGVIHNHQLQPGVEEDVQTWYWYRDQVHAPTLYDEAKKAGFTTASVLWPVTGRSSITYSMPEIMALPGENQILKVLSAGSPLFLLRAQIRSGKLRRGTREPYLDRFATDVGADLVRRKKPGLFMMHLVCADSHRHDYGVFSTQAGEALEEYDRCVGKMVQAVKEGGIYDQTAFVLTSDHGLVDVYHHVYPNNILQRAGLMEGELSKGEWDAYCQGNGAGAFVYVRDNDPGILQLVDDLLEQAAANREYGIQAVYDREKLAELGAVPRSPGEGMWPAFALEAAPGYHIGEELTERDVVPQEDFGKPYATHGYNPHRPGYGCLFLACGAGVRSVGDIGPMNAVDVAPTLAKVMGFSYPACDGRALEGLLVGQE